MIAAPQGTAGKKMEGWGEGNGKGGGDGNEWEGGERKGGHRSMREKLEKNGKWDEVKKQERERAEHWKR